MKPNESKRRSSDGHAARFAAVLKALAEGTDRITDISTRLKLNKATVHRLLKTLEESGFILQDPVNRTYYLGPLVISLATDPIAAHGYLTTCAQEEMHHLSELTQETVAIQIPIGTRRLFLEEVPSPQNLRHVMGKGTVAPLYTGSGGKVMLADLPQKELKIVLRSMVMEQLRPNTISDQNRLLREIETARKQGFATSFGELVEGSASISVPVKNYVCPVALSIFGPEFRFTGMLEVLTELKKCARQISEKLKDCRAYARK